MLKLMFYAGVYLLILLFSYTGISKIIEYNEFLIKIMKSPLLLDFARPVSVLTPLAELTTVFLLLMRRFLKSGLLLACFLLTMYTSYLFIGVSYHAGFSCACSGVFGSLGYREHLVVNIILCCVSIYSYLFSLTVSPR